MVPITDQLKPPFFEGIEPALYSNHTITDNGPEEILDLVMEAANPPEKLTPAQKKFQDLADPLNVSKQFTIGKRFIQKHGKALL